MERNVTSTSRLSHMENATNAALDENARFKSIEDLMNSPETSAMNDRAQVEIWGSEGTTYTEINSRGDTIGTKENPIPGKLDEIRKNPRYGTKEEDRIYAAEAYEKDINDLLEDGYELSQAKLIMDLREDDRQGIDTLVGKKIGQGTNPLVAKKQARKLYEKKDKQRNELIYDKGIRNREEYSELLSIDSSKPEKQDSQEAKDSKSELPPPVVKPATKDDSDKKDVFAAPDIKTRTFNQKEFDEANDNLQKAIENGDEELFKKSVAFLRNEEVAKGLITGSNNLDSFNNFVSSKWKELENRKNSNNKSDDSKTGKSSDTDASDNKKNPPPPPLYTNIGGSTNVNDGDDSDKGTPLPPPLPLPVPLDSKPTKEKKSVGKRVLAGVLVGAAVIGSLFVAKNALDDDSSVENLDKTEETTETTDNTSGETTPLNDSALDKMGAFETQPETNGDEQEEASSEEELAELKQAIKERTVEIADTQSEFGNTTWDKATVLYGALATPMLIEAAEAVAADGIEVEWTADPNTSTEADLFINGTNDPSVVWQFLAPRLAKEDVTNFLENIETNSSGDEVLPETE